MTQTHISKQARRLILTTALGAVLLLAGCLGTQTTDANAEDDPGSDLEAQRTTSGLNWHPQSGEEGAVPGAEGTLYTTAWASFVHIRTTGLVPGNVYTLWWVLFNDPEACEQNPEPCAAGDIFAAGNPAQAQVSYAAGDIADAAGEATFNAHFELGPVDGWLPESGFTDLWDAEHHFTINDHGPLVEENMPDMIHSYRGGCSDDSPFPDIFPATALADGEAGPNECRLSQSVIFQQ